MSWYLFLPPTSQDLTQGQWLEGQLLWGFRLGTSRGLSPAGLCWSSASLVQCGSDEPSLTWTQIWVQACMPDYSLNWTARSRAIQGWQKCQWCSLPTQRCPSQSGGPFDLKFAIEHWPSDTDTRQSTEKPLHHWVSLCIV